MQDPLIANGYTSVILVVNMERFVNAGADNARLFNSVRGTTTLQTVLQEALPSILADSPLFSITDAYSDQDEDHTPADVTGFLTGVFRHTMVENYSAPTYRINKDKIEFSPKLMSNYQFRRLFLPIWKRWEIYIRPTMTGMFVIRLVRRYDDAASMLQLAKDVQDLQTSLDLQGALEQFEKIETEFGHDPKTANDRKESVQLFLDWLGVKTGDKLNLNYVPVQWQLAMTICQAFVAEIGCKIDLGTAGAIQLEDVQREVMNQLHDSYVIYHLDQLMTYLGKDSKPSKNARHVSIEELRASAEYQGFLVNLLEGAMLVRQQTGEDDSIRRYFPSHDPSMVEKYFQSNQSTWYEELCLMTARSAIVMPSRRDRQADLYVSTLPATPTTRVKYLQYWEALERMIEFAAEIRVLAQLLERGSARILIDFVQKLRQMRAELLGGDLQLDRVELLEIVEESANLNRLVGLCQSLSNPYGWSRAEYGAEKATRLLDDMRVTLLLQHAQQNVNNLTGLVNHTDELYLASLSERANARATWLSLVLGALSLSIILFSLPSFWADISQLNSNAIDSSITEGIIPFITRIGSLIGPVLIVISAVIIAVSILFILRATGRTVRQRSRGR